MALIDVDIDDYLDEASDHALRKEVLARGFMMVEGAFANLDKPDDDVKNFVFNEEVADALHDLMCRRHAHALERVRAAIATLVPASLLSAYEAIQNGRISAAICDLDRILEPGPSATATSLPMKRQPIPAEANP